MTQYRTLEERIFDKEDLFSNWLDRVVVEASDLAFSNGFSSSKTYKPISDAKLATPVDIYGDADGSLKIEVAATGIDPDDIKLFTKSGDILEVKYDKKRNEQEDDIKYIHRGIAKRSFNLSWKISAKYDLSKMEASFYNGLLIISIPLCENMEPKEIKINKK